MKPSCPSRIKLIFPLFLVVFFLTGCWDRTEINDLALITGAGIDQKDEKTIELSVLVFIPKGTAGGQSGLGGGGGAGGAASQTLVHSAEGSTIADAMSKLQQKLPRHIFWGHSEVFIIHQDVAKDGIRDKIDFIMRHPQLRERSYVFVSKEKAKDILKLTPPLERDLTEVLEELADFKMGIEVTVKDLAQMLSGPSRTAALPWIKRLPKEEKQTSAFIVGTAVFKNDKMLGHINDSVTRGVLWLRNEIELAVVTVTPKEAKEGQVSLNLLRAHTELIPKIENGQWKMTIKAVTEDDVVHNGTNLDVSNPETTKMLEQELKNDIERSMKSALNQLQKDMNADIIGFAQAFRRKYPKEWKKAKKRWDTIFPEVEVSFDIRAYVRRPGMVTTPAGLPEDEVKKK